MTIRETTFARPDNSQSTSVEQVPDRSNSNENQVEDWQWLVSGEAACLLTELSSNPLDPLKLARYLRKQGLSASRCRIVAEQLSLRPKAAKKFSNASQLFFERTLLQQATDERLAAYKANRFAAAPSIVDICCGMGGDLMALCTVDDSTCVGVDASQVACAIASANCTATNFTNAEVVCSSAEQYDIDPSAWVHIDPDRRVGGRRSTTLECFSPDAEYLHKMNRANLNVAIKLAPVTKLPDDSNRNNWEYRQRQWLGDRHECKQQLVWFGETCRNDTEPNTKTATAIDRDGSVLFDWHETTPGICRVTNELGEFLYEPHSTVIAGRMIDSLAEHYELRRLESDIQYLTGAKSAHPALTRFRILESCRMEERAVKQRLDGLNAGHLEIKKRGVDHKLIDRFSRLKLTGDRRLVLVLTRHKGGFVAIICDRDQ